MTDMFEEMTGMKRADGEIIKSILSFATVINNLIELGSKVSKTEIIEATDDIENEKIIKILKREIKIVFENRKDYQYDELEFRRAADYIKNKSYTEEEYKKFSDEERKKIIIEYRIKKYIERFFEHEIKKEHLKGILEAIDEQCSRSQYQNTLGGEDKGLNLLLDYVIWCIPEIFNFAAGNTTVRVEEDQ